MSPGLMKSSPGGMGISSSSSLRGVCSTPKQSRAAQNPRLRLLRFARNDKTSSYRLMHGHELRPIGERRLDLDLGYHLGDAVHHLRAGDDVRAALHQLGDGFAV